MIAEDVLGQLFEPPGGLMGIELGLGWHHVAMNPSSVCEIRDGNH